MHRFILAVALGAGSLEAHEISVNTLLEAIPAGHPVPLLSTLLEVPPQGRMSTGLTVAPQWSADVIFDGQMIGITLKDGRGKFFYDRPGERYRLNYTADSKLFHPDGKLEQDMLATNSTMAMNYTWGGIDANGACNPFPNKYSDFFAWLAIAKPEGNTTVEGKPCSLWTAKIPGPMGKSTSLNMTACVADDGSVLEMLQSIGGSGKFSGDSRYRFSNVTFGAPGDAAFLPTYPCSENWPGKPCPDDGVETLDIYRIFGKGEPLVLSNRDTGDVLGDVSFICTQGSGAEYESKYITHWQVEVSKAYGQYALCNFNGTANVCMGGGSQLQHVGRRGSQIQSGKPAIGQCSLNEDVGSQYSFPTAGECPPGVTPGEAAGCFWANARPIRTVHANCVMQDRKLLEVCKNEFGHAPFTQSAAIFRDALASADATRGGCPHAPVTTIVI